MSMSESCCTPDLINFKYTQVCYREAVEALILAI